jgi:PhnB protein
MAKRSPRPAGMPWITPYLTVKDASAALDFYQRAFGFEKRVEMPGPDGRITHAEMSWRDGVIMMGPEGAYGATTKAPATSGTEAPINIYVYCDDVDALCARAKAAGAKVTSPPQDMFWGDRCCKLIDPSGYSWSFATNVGDFDPSKAPA